MKYWSEDGGYDRAREGLLKCGRETLTRTEACKVMGISSDAFSRDFRYNSLYIAYGEMPKKEWRADMYKVSELIAQVDRLEGAKETALGCKLRWDYQRYRDGEITAEDWDNEGYKARPEKVFDRGTYLYENHGWIELE